MTAATVPALLPLEEIVRQREGLQTELSQLEREAAALPAQINTAIDAGDTATALKLERRRLPHVKEQIAALLAQLAAVCKDEETARERAFRERQQRELAQAQHGQGLAWGRVLPALDALARACGDYRRATETVAELESAGNAERRRQVVHRDSGGGHLEVAGATLGEWLAHDPAVQLDLSLLDRFNDVVAELPRRLRDRFFAKP